MRPFLGDGVSAAAGLRACWGSGSGGDVGPVAYKTVISVQKMAVLA